MVIITKTNTSNRLILSINNFICTRYSVSNVKCMSKCHIDVCSVAPVKKRSLKGQFIWRNSAQLGLVVVVVIVMAVIIVVVEVMIVVVTVVIVVVAVVV